MLTCPSLILHGYSIFHHSNILHPTLILVTLLSGWSSILWINYVPCLMAEITPQSWFLRLDAPIFYKPLTYLFNLSLANLVTNAVETCLDTTCFKSDSTSPPFPVSSNIHHSSPNMHDGEMCCQAVCLSSHSQTASCLIHLRPVCL